MKYKKVMSVFDGTLRIRSEPNGTSGICGSVSSGESVLVEEDKVKSSSGEEYYKLAGNGYVNAAWMQEKSNQTDLSEQVIEKLADKETLDKTYENTNQILTAVEDKKPVIVRYGMKINKNDSNPETRCTYIYDAEGMTPARMNFTTGTFEFGDWKDIFFVKNNYPAMIKYDGTEDYKLDPNDHTKKADGTESDVSNTSYNGNAMSVFDGSGENGKIWLSQYEDEDAEYMIISNVQYDESYHDDAYVREDGSHADKLYYPMFGGSYDGTRLRSLAGQALMYNTNTQTEINRAKANGAGWNIGSWSKRNLLDCMLKIMSKTDNSQTAFGRGQTSGYVNDASQNYGHLATGTLTNKGQFFGYKDTTHEVKVFYIEKWWGNRWDRINGLLMVGGEILAKMTPPYNLTGKDFEKVGITFTSSSSGWQKGTKSSRFGRIVNSIGGSSSTYTCDYFWWNAGITAVALVGGYCSDGDYGGADFLNLNTSAGVANWHFGASVFLEQPIAA